MSHCCLVKYLPSLLALPATLLHSCSFKMETFSLFTCCHSDSFFVCCFFFQMLSCSPGCYGTAAHTDILLFNIEEAGICFWIPYQEVSIYTTKHWVRNSLWQIWLPFKMTLTAIISQALIENVVGSFGNCKPGCASLWLMKKVAWKHSFPIHTSTAVTYGVAWPVHCDTCYVSMEETEYLRNLKTKTIPDRKQHGQSSSKWRLTGWDLTSLMAYALHTIQWKNKEIKVSFLFLFLRNILFKFTS